MSDDEPYNSSLEAAEDYQEQIDTLLAEVKRLSKLLKGAYKFVSDNPDVWDSMQEHLDHWSDINHMFDVTGDKCNCVDCCTAEVCPDCHACLEHYECQCEEAVVA